MKPDPKPLEEENLLFAQKLKYKYRIQAHQNGSLHYFVNNELSIVLPPRPNIKNNNPAMDNYTFFNFTILAKNCTLENFKVKSLVNSTVCRAPKHSYHFNLKFMDTDKWYSANDRYDRVLLIFFVTCIIDVVHSLIRMIRGLGRK